MIRRFWTPEEDECMRRDYRRLHCREIAAALGRSRRAIYMRAKTLGISVAMRCVEDPTIEAAIREFHPRGWSDAEISQQLAQEHGIAVERHRVGVLRKRLGLDHNALSDHRRRKVAARTREQLAAAGLRSMGELRVRAYREFARNSGWPEYLRPRAVQILNAIYEHGPQTRRALCELTGMPWKGKKSLVSNDPGHGSYLAALAAWGFVLRLRKAHRVTGRGKGHSCDLYMIPLTIKRGDPTTWPPTPTATSKRRPSPTKSPCKPNCVERRSQPSLMTT